MSNILQPVIQNNNDLNIGGYRTPSPFLQQQHTQENTDEYYTHLQNNNNNDNNNKNNNNNFIHSNSGQTNQFLMDNQDHQHIQNIKVNLKKQEKTQQNQKLAEDLNETQLENLQKVRDQVYDKIHKKLQRIYTYFNIQEEHISMISNTFSDIFVEKIYDFPAFEQGLQYIESRVEPVFLDEQKIYQILREILKSPIECQNKIMSCSFNGTYQQYISHLDDKCDYEFDDENILRACSKQKDFTEIQKQFYLEDDDEFYNIPENQNLQYNEGVPTLLVANFPQVGMVELFKKFGEIEKFHFDKKNNLIMYVTYKSHKSFRLAIEQLSQVEIAGKRLRVTQFISKEVLNKCRLFIKGLQTNNELFIKQQLEFILGLHITQVSLLNQKSMKNDASAFIQFEQPDLEKAQGLINNVYVDTSVGKKISVKEYRTREQNPNFGKQSKMLYRNQ